MDPMDKGKLLHGLMKLAAAFDRAMSQPQQEVYLEDLADVPIDSLIQAIVQARKTCKFFPSIAELRELAGAGTGGKALEDRAMQVWDDLRRLSGRKAYNPEALMDPITRKCWKALGGTLGFGQWDYEKQEEWKRKEFIGLYVSYAKHPQRFEELTHEESAGVLGNLNERGILRHGEWHS